jgi:hypothetical protein
MDDHKNDLAGLQNAAVVLSTGMKRVMEVSYVRLENII